MKTVTSKDGTQIAYDTKGSGPALILVDGALCYRGFGPMPGLAELLAPEFTVYTYDRRGRGESSNGHSSAVEREIEDIDALIQAAGGHAFVYGISSGACLGLEAALKLGNKITRLAMYEPPYNSDQAARAQWHEYRKQLDQALTEGRRGDAVVLFMKLVGTPDDAIDGMRQAPMWPMFEAVAPTLENDAADIGEDRTVPVERAAKLGMPVLIMDGGANLQFLPFMHESATALAKAIPQAQHRTLEGQTHDAKPDAIAPALVEFFKS
ncbi:MAG: alpha/beta fold hydrolase [Anaerolineae bacterium]